MGPPLLIELPPQAPVFPLGYPTTPRFGKLFDLVESRCDLRRIQLSGRFEIICHIPTENVVREEQESSRSKRTNDRTGARRGNEAKAWKSRPESLESASKLNKT
jgi:hypothetical protein